RLTTGNDTGTGRRGREEQRVHGAVVGSAVPELERPQAVDGDPVVSGAAQLTARAPLAAVVAAESGDLAVAEVADQQVAGDLVQRAVRPAGPGRRKRLAPRRRPASRLGCRPC